VNFKIGANVATLLVLAVVGWLLYGAYKTGQALPSGVSSTDYTATTA